MAVDEGDRILLAGYSLSDFSMSVTEDGDVDLLSFSAGDADLFFKRLTSTGAIDTAYGTDGTVTGGVASLSETLTSIKAVDTEETFVLMTLIFTGAEFRIGLTNYNDEGMATSDETNLTLALPSSFWPYDATVDSQGRIILAGGLTPTSDFAVVRFLSGGVLDESFGNGGLVVAGSSCAHAAAFHATVAGDGSIYLIGDCHLENNGDTQVNFGIVKLTDGGELDLSFGGDGIVTTNIGTLLGTVSDDRAYTAMIDASSNLVVAGTYHETFADEKFAVVRYTTTGELDTSFGEPVVFQDTGDDSGTATGDSGSATGSSGGCALVTSANTSSEYFAILLAVFIFLGVCRTTA